MTRDLDILVLAGGRGSRMSSDIPKVLHPLLGEPLIHHVLDAARELEPREIGVIVGHAREEVKRALAGYEVSFVVQREQKGTGHAVRCAARRFAGRRGNVMVLSGDVPLIRGKTLKAFLDNHRRSRSAASLITATLEHPGSLGRVVRDEAGRLVRIVEAREADFAELAIREINSGIYLFRNEALFEGLKNLRAHPASGEYYLTDVVKALASGRGKVHAEAIADPNEALGINTGGELLSAQETLRRRIALEHTARGVELVDPASTFIAKGVTLGPGTVVWPFSVIMGGVKVGARCRIGPFAHLRPGTVLEDGAAVGNFVEVKDARLGAETLALHLAYIGDAELGRGVNVGAGTVTANFDGRDKHRTVVEDGAFLGSGSILVAPVRVGKDAVVGAGSVVTRGRDVPPGATVFGVPARQAGTKDESPAPGRSAKRAGRGGGAGGGKAGGAKRKKRSPER